MKKIKANTTVAGAGVGVALAWSWNAFVVDPPMDAVAAAGIAPLLGHIIRWVVAWLPEPGGDDAKTIE